jgi:zinc protease
MSLSIEPRRFGMVKMNQPQASQPARAASVPVAHSNSPALAQPSSAALRSQVLFGSSYEPQHPKLTYTQLPSITDPILGKMDVYQFSNGMKFYGLQRDDVPLVSFGEVINTGSLNEKAKENGVSHFLEHLIFKGSKHLGPGEFVRKMENVGGKINAFTYFAQTFYYTYDLPKDQLQEAIKLRAEFIQNVNLPPAELEKERTTVVGEIKRADDKPNTTLWETIKQAVWGDSPLRRPVLGPQKIIENISRDTIMDCYYRFYAPENRSIIMVGDFDMKQALDGIANEYNVPFPQKTTRPNRKKLKPVYPPGQRDITFHRDVRSATVTTMFDGPRGGTPQSGKKAQALEIASNILGEGESSRLHRRLVEDEKLAHWAGATFLETKGRSLTGLMAGADPDKADAVRKIFREELEKIATHGVTDAEISKAMEQTDTTISNNVQTQIELTGDLAIAISNLNLEQSFGKRLDTGAAMTSADIQQAVREFLAEDKAYNITMLPEPPKAEPAANASATVAPAGVRFSGALTSKEASRTLNNGIEVLLREKPTVRRNAISVNVRGGDSLESVPGEAVVLAQLMSRATGATGNEAFQEHLDSKGIKLSVGNGSESFTISLDAKATNNQAMLDVVGDMLKSGPTFRQEDFDLIISLRRKALEDRLANNPTNYGSSTLYKQLFPGHPYGTNTLDNQANLDKVTLDGVKALYHKMMQPQNITSAMAGNITMDSLATAAEGWTADLKNAGAPAKDLELPAIKPLTESKFVTVAAKNENEMKLSEIYRGWHATGYSDSDRAAAKVMNAVLRGGMSSRLFQTFREGDNGGLCYSVSSTLDEYAKGGLFNLYIGTAHKNVPLVLDLFQKEVDKLINTVPTEEEMTRAINTIESSLHSGEQTVQGLAASFGHRIFDTENKWDRLDKMKKVTAQDVQAFAKKYLGKPSVTVMVAPETVLKANNLPVNGEKILAPGQVM